MHSNVIGIDVVTTGNFDLIGEARYASNRALVACSANIHDLLTQPGYCFTQCIIRAAQNTDIECIATLFSSMCWNLFKPTWTGFLPLTDDMIIICSAASVNATRVRFNLSFAPLPEYLDND